MPRRPQVLGLVAAATVLGLAGWLVASRVRGTRAPTPANAHAAPRTTAPDASTPGTVTVDPDASEPLRRELAARPSTDSATGQGSEPDPADQALIDELWALQDLVPVKVYELLRHRFANDATGTVRLCQLAVIEAAANEVIFADEQFLAAVFAAWLDSTSSPHAVLAAVLAAVPSDLLDIRAGPLQSLSHCLAKRHEHLPPQREGQQRALVHALVTAADLHRDRFVTGLLVARALGYAADHDPMAQASLMRLAHSTERRIQEIAWAALAAELPPSAMLAVIDEPLPLIPDDHDAKRVGAMLASVRNAPEQREVVHRWLGARLVDLARQSRWDVEPRTDRSRLHWLYLVNKSLGDEDRQALQPALQLLAEGQGPPARFARRLLAPR